MNADQLVAALRAAGPDEVAYDICGVLLPGRLTDGGVYLRPEGEQWVVGSWERGQSSPNHWFGSEAEACARVHEIRAWQSPPPRRLTRQERAEVAAVKEKVQAENRRTI